MPSRVVRPSQRPLTATAQWTLFARYRHAHFGRALPLSDFERNRVEAVLKSLNLNPREMLLLEHAILPRTRDDQWDIGKIAREPPFKTSAGRPATKGETERHLTALLTRIENAVSAAPGDQPLPPALVRKFSQLDPPPNSQHWPLVRLAIAHVAQGATPGDKAILEGCLARPVPLTMNEICAKLRELGAPRTTPDAVRQREGQLAEKVARTLLKSCPLYDSVPRQTLGEGPRPLLSPKLATAVEAFLRVMRDPVDQGIVQGLLSPHRADPRWEDVASRLGVPLPELDRRREALVGEFKKTLESVRAVGSRA
ncbi:MAG: hypothetical protein ACKVPX_08535 [Myxococcaceae bacterium]